MTTTKVKPTEVIGDHLPILTFQVKRIMQNCQYQVDTKNEWVQWVTADVNRTSLKSVTQAQAKKIIRAQEGSLPLTPSKGGGTDDANSPFGGWGAFDKTNPKHKVILSLLYQANWTVMNNLREIPDMERFAKFLQTKAPVKKPLTKQTDEELEKTIKAFKGVVKSTYK